MIRDFAPVLLIPAAWILTLATIFHGFDVYWIRHMHYFIILFLTGFTVFSWSEMGDNSVLRYWRLVIGGGIVFTFFGALSFSVQSFSNLLAGVSLFYWIAAPGAAFYSSAKLMNRYSRAYKLIAGSSILAGALFLLSSHFNASLFSVFCLLVVLIAQLIGMICAVKLSQG